MKQVIFICLLSLSMCLSRPDGQLAQPIQEKTADKPTVDTKTQLQPKLDSVPASNNITPHPDHPATQEKVDVPASELKPTPPNQAQTEVPKENQTKPDTNENKTTPDKKEAEAPTEKKDKPTDPPKTDDKNAGEKQPVPVTTEKAATTIVTEPPKKDATVTTVKPEVTTKPTPAPKAADTVVQARGFDGASFVGGIILTLGLLAIGFMGLKYYKNQTERNYHTL